MVNRLHDIRIVFSLWCKYSKCILTAIWIFEEQSNNIWNNLHIFTTLWMPQKCTLDWNAQLHSKLSNYLQTTAKLCSGWDTPEYIPNRFVQYQSYSFINLKCFEILPLNVDWILKKKSGGWFNIKMSYQYRKSHYRNKTILRPSYLQNGISYTCKTTYSYWIRVLVGSGWFLSIQYTSDGGFIQHSGCS